MFRKLIMFAVLFLSAALLSAQSHAWRVAFQAVDQESLAIGRDLLYCSGLDGSLIALDPASGAERWRFQVGSPKAASNVMVVGDTAPRAVMSGMEFTARRIILQRPVWHSPFVFVASRHSKPEDRPNFYALDELSGKVRWSFFTPGGAFDAVPSAGDRVLVVGETFIHALDVATGQKHWSFEPLAGLHEAARRSPSPPVVADGGVFVTVWPFHQFDAPRHSYLYALDEVSGEVRWTVDVPGNDPTPPLLHDDRVYFAVQESAVERIEGGAIVPTGGTTAHVFAVDKKTGHVRWKTAFESPEHIRTLLVRGDALYAGAVNYSGRGDGVITLDMKTGAVRARVRDALLIEPAPETAGVYAVRNGALASLAPSPAASQRSIRLNKDAIVHFFDGRVLYVSWGKRLAAFDVRSGSKRWEKRLDSGVGTLAVKDASVFVVTRGHDVIGGTSRLGSVYRLDAATGRDR